MIRVLYRHRSGAVIDELPLDQIPAVLKDARSRLWVDLSDPSDDEVQSVLHELFPFQNTAIQSSEIVLPINAVDDHNDYIRSTVHVANQKTEDTASARCVIELYLGTNYLVTLHSQPCHTIEERLNIEFHQERGLALGSARLHAEVMHGIVDDYVQHVAELGLRTSELLDDTVASTSAQARQLLYEIQVTQTNWQDLYSDIADLREVMSRLSGTMGSFIPQEVRADYRIEERRLHSLIATAETQRQILDRLSRMQIGLNLSHQTEILHLFTAINVIFLPLIFVAVILSITIQLTPPAAVGWLYAVAWLAFFIFAVSMLFYLRRRGWL